MEETAWDDTECVLCGLGYVDHIEPSSDTPVCTGCAPSEGPMPEPNSQAWHAMGWPTEHVAALRAIADKYKAVALEAYRYLEDMGKDVERGSQYLYGHGDYDETAKEWAETIRIGLNAIEAPAEVPA